MEGVRGQSQDMNEVYDTINRVASRLGIFKDRATALLLRYKWDGEKLVSAYKKSPDNGGMSYSFEPNPTNHFHSGRRKCCLCNDITSCINIGCGDYVCDDKCFKEHIESKIHKELDMRCPKCRKFLSYSWIYRKMSKEGRERYEASLLENFRHATKQPPTVTVIKYYFQYYITIFVMCYHLTIIFILGGG
ncbi:transmembrane protein [Arabidopsis thaliana]|uniref:Transmembrane protein n=1 Tax=Arabidopsis thaliana TaxID=3702 RepID=B3H6F0_ARATH|nr:uncharacterized protein AT2G43261 [Arabidopsis thaliana]NP_001118511.1 uncharacterized protein AT2G43261 [Arabidopsis thaliana]AEC10243.1 transmembrane protein [Arabidopsis thaliana]AEC10244.1 transmembrane protein [Arabidopsis thaliana]|eukprot:NP_001118510.1 transmembrane protein [Arabidopsis thaliana]